jgi:hypothetical protein
MKSPVRDDRTFVAMKRESVETRMLTLSSLMGLSISARSSPTVETVGYSLPSLPGLISISANIATLKSVNENLKKLRNCSKFALNK